MVEPLWSSEAAAQATKGQAIGCWQADSLSIDTRSLKPGALFIALKDRRDGEVFVPDALAAGAAAIMVSRAYDQTPALIVKNTETALHGLGMAGRDRCAGLRAAITGSAGKTSIKEMTACVFRAAGLAHWSEKSFNNQWGVPLSLAAMPEQTERAIFEIGMNTPGEIAPHARLIAPHIAAISCIAKAHLQGLGSVENIAFEKADIFTGLLPGGTALIPGNDRFADYLTARAKAACQNGDIMHFGTDRDHAARLVDMRIEAPYALYDLCIDGQSLCVRLLAQGQHWGLNAALVAGLAVRAGIHKQDVMDGLDQFAPPVGRGQAQNLYLPEGEAVLLDDSYNANPCSMRAALSSLQFYPGRKLVALGSMQELGDDSEALHRELLDPIMAAGVSHVFLLGQEMCGLAQALRQANIEITQFHKRDDRLVNSIVSALLPGDTLLVKGSNASGMTHIAQAILCKTNQTEGERHAG